MWFSNYEMMLFALGIFILGFVLGVSVCMIYMLRESKFKPMPEPKVDININSKKEIITPKQTSTRSSFFDEK